MSAITTKFITDHKLTNKRSLKELSQYAPEILGLLTDDKEKRPPVPERSGLEAEKVNTCQVSDSTCTEETIKETAQSSDSVVALSRLSRLRREFEQRENEGIDFPDHFLLESVKERLNLYDVSNIPNKQALADIMIMLCIRPSEIKSLCISNGNVTGYAKNRGQQDIPRVFRSLEKNEDRARQLLIWIQEAIISGQLKDPGKLGSLYLSTFLKKDEFIPESDKPLLPSFLRKLGAVFASVVHGPKNASKANTYASEALRYSPDNHASPSKRYTIVNMRKRRAHDSSSSTRIFGLDEQNYNSLKKSVKRLERSIEFLATELEDLDECVDRETVVDLIHEIALSPNIKKYKDSSYSSESSEESDLVETVV
ncbi:14140_t:CDS:2, partial [Gigaspora margarita]